MKNLKLTWSRLPVTIRAAYIGCGGVILATFIGGLFALASTLIPIWPPISPNSNGLDAFHIANIRFVDTKTPAIYGIPSHLAQPNFSGGESLQDKNNFLNENGYHVFYNQGDFAALSIDTIPTSTVPIDFKPFAPLIYEIWNLSKNEQIVIDKVIVELVEHTSPISATLEMYIWQGAGAVGGGNELPIQEFDATLSSKSKSLNVFNDAATRLLLKPNEGLVVVLNLGFDSPGTYKFKTFIHYHLPDGTSNVFASEDLTYGWIHVDFLDGSKLHIIK